MAQQCEVLFREIISRYSLNVVHSHSSSLTANTISANSGNMGIGATIWFSQFQLLMAMIAIERNELKTKKSESGGRQVAFAHQSGRSLFTGAVMQPTVTRSQGMYTSHGSHTRQAMLL